MITGQTGIFALGDAAYGGRGSAAAAHDGRPREPRRRLVQWLRRFTTKDEDGD